MNNQGEKLNKFKVVLVLLAFLFVGVACASTSVVNVDEIVSATLTASADVIVVPTVTEEPTEVVISPTLVVNPTEEIAPEPTENVLPPDVLCNQFEFYIDITIPDDMYVKAGSNFEKIWRIKNVGECTWQPYFEITYISGSELGYEKSLIGVEVKPNEFFEVSVELTAPEEVGFYKTWFMLQDPYGDNRAEYSGFFEIGNLNKPFYVSFYVPEDETIHIISPSETGTLSAYSNRYYGLYVGSFDDGEPLQAFAKFNLSSVQSHGNVIDVFFTFPNNTYYGNAWKHNCLNALSGEYFNPDWNTLYSNDYWDIYSENSPDAYITWCNSTELATHNFSSEELYSLVRQAVRNGERTIQFKFAFDELENGTSQMDYIEMHDIQLWIIVKY